MSRPLTSFMDKKGADVAKMDFCLPNAVPNFDTEAKSPKTVFKAEMDAFLSNAFLTFDNILNTASLSEVMHDAGSADPCGGVEEDSPANAGAKSPTVFEAEMDLFLSDAFRSFDTVLTTGPLSEFGKAAGSVNPCGEVEEKEMEKVSPAYAEAKSPTMLGRSCQDSGMDFVLPCAVADSVLNIGSLLDRHRGSSIPQGQGKEFTPTFDGANSPIETFESKYQLLEMDVIGQGSFGVVFKGIRQTDGNLVAIKQMMKQKKKDRYIQIPGYPQPLLTEIALMLRLRESYHCPYIIEMYDWYETSKMFTIAMEYPQESQSLWSFVYKYKLSESAARHLMYQAVRAVEHCLMNGVVHTDIHPGNFLVQKKTMTLKLIDFGLGHLFRFDGHASKDFRGAKECTPPEVQTNKKFFARPANTWALGGMLYFMMHAAYPYPISDLYAGEPKKYDEGLSKEICELIDWCLDVRPDRRPWLHQILSHDWFRTEWINEKPEFKRRKSKRKATTKAEEAEG
ncbi:serine/threonine-protein kinase pim-3 isoform X1 [Misgurnus anguillicaudatus]|uniref:serine/threonine-protein kinase pim-3 isoform X1 n=1 Tax=Misgurnus anguillicaudatus TaxID=75329 RepID=UPI003CCFB780